MGHNVAIGIHSSSYRAVNFYHILKVQTGFTCLVKKVYICVATLVIKVVTINLAFGKTMFTNSTLELSIPTCSQKPY